MQSSTAIEKKSVCFVHDWLVAMRGGEKVLEALTEIFPDAPIYTLFFKKERISNALQKKRILHSFLQYFPGIHLYYRYLLPLFPLAIRFLNVRKFDLVISTSHCVAKAVRVHKDAVHICYCHTPMRYLWGFQEEYFGRFPKLVQHLIGFYLKWLRKWDIETSKRVDFFIANSQNTANKIHQLYHKSAKVIYPPVELPTPFAEENKDRGAKEESYFLIVSALVPYKRVDLAIEVFNELKRPLKIVGNGPLHSKLKRMIRFNGIKLEGWLDSKTLGEHYAHCRAVIFPGEEDFGIVPLEAQGYGKPIIAYGKGGVLETVLAANDKRQARRSEESTGIFFYNQTKYDLLEIIHEFDQLKFEEAIIRSHARNFEPVHFKEQFSTLLKTLSR